MLLSFGTHQLGEPLLDHDVARVDAEHVAHGAAHARVNLLVEDGRGQRNMRVPPRILAREGRSSEERGPPHDEHGHVVSVRVGVQVGSEEEVLDDDGRPPQPVERVLRCLKAANETGLCDELAE